MRQKNNQKIYGILAFPARHSLSPIIHNTGFKELGINATYKIFEVEPINLDSFIKKLKAKKIDGLSVSMPYKKDIIKYLDFITPIAKKLNSVNTVYFKNGKLCGTNTDIYGVLLPIKKCIDKNKKYKIAILGAGGAASATCFAMQKIGDNITIFNRTIEKAKELGEKFGIKYKSLDEFNSINFDIIIQMTSVGMGENSKEIIIPNINFNQNQIVFESIYKPIKTEFIKRAILSGAKIITGDEMLLSQALKQFKIWTGKNLPLIKVKEKLKFKID